MIFGTIALTIALSKLGILSGGVSQYNNFEIPAMPNRLAPMLFASLTFALIPAICEELLCRELLFNEYKNLGTIVAIFISAFFFSILHFSLEKFVIYFFCGLVLGFLRAITDSVYASMLAHFIYNMFVLMYQQFFGALSEQFSEFTIIFFISSGLCFLTLFFIFGEADNQYHGYARKNVYIKRSYIPISLPLVKSSSKTLITSPSFLLCILLYIVFSIFI
jgi:membrane protease YdiL (CAAX protease family)